MVSDQSHVFLIALLGIFAALLLALLSGFAAPLILALILAALGHRFYDRLAAKLKGRKNLAALIILLIIVLAIILPFFGVITLLTNEGLRLILESRNQLTFDSQFLNNAGMFLKRFDIDISSLLQNQLTPELKNLGRFVYERIGSILSNAFSLVIGFLIMMIAIFYLLRDGHELGNFLMTAIPMREEDKIKIYHAIRTTGRAIFLGIFASAIAQGILGGVGFLVFGIPHAALWGSLTAFVSLFPFVGGYLIYIPAAIYLFLTGATTKAILFLLYNILIVSTVDNIIKPKLIGKKTAIHPFLIFLSILGGLKFFGIMGILYGPLIAAVLLVLLETYLSRSKPRTATP